MKDFNELNKKFTEQISTLELKRKEQLKQFNKAIFIYLIVFFTLIFFVFKYSENNKEKNEIVICSIVLLIYLICWQATQCKKKVSTYYKSNIVKIMFKDIANKIDYFPEKHVSCDFFDQTKFYNNYNRYYGEDLVTGMIDKTRFEFSEINVKKISGGKKKREKKIFKGIIFVADFNKEFHGMTQVTSISQSSFLNEVIGGRIQMEDAKFNNKFDVYSTDEVEARYILSPNLMERLLALNKKFNAKIQIAFSKSDVIILIDSKHNNFEAKLFSAITDSHINKDYQVANDLLSIVDELNLNTRIWTKE